MNFSSPTLIQKLQNKINIKIILDNSDIKKLSDVHIKIDLFFSQKKKHNVLSVAVVFAFLKLRNISLLETLVLLLHLG